MRHAADIPCAEQAEKGTGQEEGPGREHERNDGGDEQQADKRQDEPPSPLALWRACAGAERRGCPAPRSESPAEIDAVHARRAVQRRGPVVHGELDEQERQEVEQRKTGPRATARCISSWPLPCSPPCVSHIMHIILQIPPRFKGLTCVRRGVSAGVRIPNPGRCAAVAFSELALSKGFDNMLKLGMVCAPALEPHAPSAAARPAACQKPC